jgi:hypothetical protein
VPIASSVHALNKLGFDSWPIPHPWCVCVVLRVSVCVCASATLICLSSLVRAASSIRFCKVPSLHPYLRVPTLGGIAHATRAKEPTTIQTWLPPLAAAMEGWSPWAWKPMT